MSLLVFLIIIIGLYFFGLGFFNVVKKLMKKNPENVKATNVDGWTPIHFAANNGIYCLPGVNISQNSVPLGYGIVFGS